MRILNKQKKNIISVFFTEFIRLRGVLFWSAVSFAGFILGISTLDLSNYIIPLLVLLVSTFFIMSFTFAINNYYDADSDRDNPRRKNINAIVSGIISKRIGIFLNLTFVIIPLVVTFLFKIEVFLFCIFFLFWMWIYSSPPLRLKGRPSIDVIWHFFAVFLIVIWGSLVAGSINLINWLTAISLGLWSTVCQVDNHIRDYSFDKDSGTNTYAVWVGIDKAKTTISVLTFIHLIFLIPLILLYSLSYYITIIIVIGIPLIGFIILKPKKGAYPTNRCFTYFFIFVLGGAVYFSCLVYHILLILGEPSLNLLKLTNLL